MHRPALWQKLLPEREICLKCRMPEKFLSRIGDAGIALCRAQIGQDDALILRVRGTDAPGVRALAEKYSLRIVSDRAVGRDLQGLLRAAWPFALGFALCAAAFWPLKERIWKIDVQCPAGGNGAQILSALSEAGVEQGGLFPKVDPLARELESLCPGYAHISVRRDGVVLLVEAYRETDAPEVYDAAAARDLVAKYDAVVEEIMVLSGKAAVQPGDVVRAGQALILGEEKETDETMRGVRALGEVTGRVWAYAEAQTTCSEVKKEYTGRERTRAALKLFGWTAHLTDAQDFPLQETRKQRAAVGGLFLPLHIERETLREIRFAERQTDEGVLRAALEARAMAEAMAKLPENAQIVDKWTDYSMMEDNRLVLRLCLQARLPIAAARGEPEK